MKFLADENIPELTLELLYFVVLGEERIRVTSIRR